MASRRKEFGLGGVFVAAAAAGLVILSTGCHRGAPTHASGAGSADGALHPSQLIYQFIQESGGTRPSAGAKVLLGFDPSGEAYLYALRPKEHVAYHGSWTYTDGQMTLRFTSPSLTVDARFALNLADREVSLPFQVFAGKPGTSRWQASPLSITQGTYAAYYAAAVDPEHARSQADAVDHAFAYAKARLELERAPSTARESSAGSAGVAARLVPAASADSPSDDCVADQAPIKVVHNGLDDLLFYYACGAIVRIQFRPIVDQPRQAALTHAPLSGDPRVFIDPLNPGQGKDDPPSKTVLIFAPFVDQGNTGKPYPFESLTNMSDYEDGAATPAPDPSKFSVLPALRAHGYDAKNVLIDSGASVVGLVSALSGNPNPGFVILDSHGGGDGTLATGDYWPLVIPPGRGYGSVWPGYWSYLTKLRAAGLADLIDYGRPANSTNAWYSDTLQVWEMPNKHDDPTTTYAVAALTPKFWEWARTARHVDFHRSLVYVSACDTDQTDALRNAIQARAYFAWQITVNADLAAGVGRYLAASLIRPTHTAEEAFDNLARIASKRNMIYVEDTLLNGLVGTDTLNLNGLNAYGWQEDKLLPYRCYGWYGTAAQRSIGSGQPDATAQAWQNVCALGNPAASAIAFDAGQVWWVLFAARWSQDPKEGEQKILNCLNQIWRPGKSALSSPQCNAYNGGRIPTDDEVGYAMYLLRGEPNPSFSGQIIPRWTLDDGA